ncbi:MAG: rhomboid family intramembrane serine protease [Deltaproteobacteria bacterium]|nr:rhomboid family intramembrane serine protease [Deltaproteobacteria bacterium]
MMQCPRCSFPLQELTANNVVVDACPRCAGAFYESLDATTGLDPNAEIKKLCAAGSAKVQKSSGLRCPRGHGPLIAYRCEAPDHERAVVEIDACQTCKGIWLDANEAHVLQKIALQSGQVSAGAGWYLLQLFTGLPLEVYHPVRRRPLMVWALIVSCIAVFVVELVWAGANQLPAFIHRYGMVPNEVLHGRQVWSLVTYAFLHGGFGHIFGNIVYLYIFGDNIEDRIGRLKFLVLYLVCGVVAGLAQFASGYNSEVPLVGASGAIAGMLGAYLVLFPRVRLFMVIFFVRFKISVWFYLGGWILMNVVMGSAQKLEGAGAAHGTAWWCHVGGFATGVLWALLFRKRILATT